MLFAGVDVNEQASAQRFTALMLAAFIGCPARTSLLLEQGGASTFVMDADGYTALEYAGARDAGQPPFFPINDEDPSPLYVRNRTHVELLILRKRLQELDESNAEEEADALEEVKEEL